MHEVAVQELPVRCLVLVMWMVGSVFQHWLSDVMSPDRDVFQSPSSAHSSDAAYGEDSADKMSECSCTVCHANFSVIVHFYTEWVEHDCYELHLGKRIAKCMLNILKCCRNMAFS